MIRKSVVACAIVTNTGRHFTALHVLQWLLAVHQPVQAIDNTSIWNNSIPNPYR